MKPEDSWWDRLHLAARIAELELEVKRAKFREGEYRDGMRAALRSFGCSEWLTDTAMTAIEKSVEKKAQEITS